MEFIRQYESSGDSEEEPPQQEASFSSDSEEEPPQQEASFRFSSKDFYNSNTVAPKGISLSTVRYEASKNDHNDDHNQERCHSRVSSTVSDIDLIDYLKEHDPITDSDISIESEGSEYVPSKENIQMLDSDMNSDEECPMSPKSQKSRKNCQAKVDSPKIDFQSPERMKSPLSNSTPKRGKVCSSPMSESSPTIGSSKSPNWTPLENPNNDLDVYVGQVANFLKEKIKNDHDIKKYLGGKRQPSIDHITTQVHQNNEGGENHRKYNKKHICYICGACLIDMRRHFIDKHKDVPEIERIEKMELNSQERRNAIVLLTLKGDFLHNCAVMLEQRGVLFVLRRPDANNPTEPEDYIPCIYCLGFVQNTQVYRHAKNCHFKITGFGTDSNRIVRQGKSLLYKMINPDDGSNDEWQEIKTKIRQDDVGKYIINDDTFVLGVVLLPLN